MDGMTKFLGTCIMTEINTSLMQTKQNASAPDSHCKLLNKCLFTAATSQHSTKDTQPRHNCTSDIHASFCYHEGQQRWDMLTTAICWESGYRGRGQWGMQEVWPRRKQTRKNRGNSRRMWSMFQGESSVSRAMWREHSEEPQIQNEL